MTIPTDPTAGSASPDTTARPALRIDVVSDVVCPWCFIGKRQLETALQSWQDDHPDQPAPEVVWHPFQLNPDMPAEGMARDDYLQRKFGTADTSSIYANVRRAAETVGLSLSLDGIARQPSTLAPHVLLQLAAEQGRQPALAERLFEAYFIENRNLADRDTLLTLAAEAGLDTGSAAAALDDPQRQQEIAGADAHARSLGISGVPFFIIDRSLAVSGAQGADRLRAAFEQAALARTSA